eukprot:CAMPEP_0174265112 /NCGR_PEP_ID=MMETSP0439-20130205/25301_1 /TAXON_ID=0 /ORGANISM="Stereomyxa ramosa, Strain Chinc5" /LENGTH=280 /DNA_ID=CAMNT_0015351397 /DNA_START=49 /DNA_END=891 /DNA_ORIENTATION=-
MKTRTSQRRLSTTARKNINEHNESNDNKDTIKDFKNEQEFFGFHPVHFVDDIINAVNRYVCDACDALEKSLEVHIDKEVCSEATNKIWGEMQKNVDKYFDTWELYVLRNVFVVPDSFLQHKQMLSERNSNQQQNQLLTSLQNTSPNDSNLDAQLEKLQKEILRREKRRQEYKRINGNLDIKLQQANAYHLLQQNLSNLLPDHNLSQIETMLEEVIEDRKQVLEYVQQIAQMDWHEDTTELELGAEELMRTLGQDQQQLTASSSIFDLETATQLPPSNPPP